MLLTAAVVATESCPLRSADVELTTELPRELTTDDVAVVVGLTSLSTEFIVKSSSSVVTMKTDCRRPSYAAIFRRPPSLKREDETDSNELLKLVIVPIAGVKQN